MKKIRIVTQLNQSITIISGPIRSGKTTRLLDWCKDRSNVGGILTPDINNLRHIFDVSNKSYLPFEISEEDISNYSASEIITIGKFVFLENAFRKMENIILQDVRKNLDWVIIDELGKLEMRDKGLSQVISKLIKDSNQIGGTKIILVIRESLLEDAIHKFDIDNPRIIRSSSKKNSSYNI